MARRRRISRLNKIVIAIRTIKDLPTALIAIAATIILLKTKKIKEPHIILVAALIGLDLKLFSPISLSMLLLLVTFVFISQKIIFPIQILIVILR